MRDGRHAALDYEQWEILYRLFLHVRLRGIRAAFLKLWPPRREKRPALDERRRAA